SSSSSSATSAVGEPTPPAAVSDPTATPASVAVPAPQVDVSGPPDAPLLARLPPRVLLFADALQPLFRDKCGKCHLKAEPAGGLSVGEHAQLLEGGYSGAGVVPKDRRASVVMQRLVLAPSDGDHMPPEGEPALSADEIELVGAWIDQGAPARDTTETAKLSVGAARALSAHGVKPGPASPPPLAARAGGCGACSVPGALQSRWLSLQALAFFAGAAVLAVRHRRRRAA
ncbi:MAG TPA: c-type cytochrome domain-containing protein, partial [Polyangiaceae bacterium]|nr:c-type cytochrome domain-containing protein [Polyangiaceae bacterium]